MFLRVIPLLLGFATAICSFWSCVTASADPYGDAVLAHKPVAYFRFEEAGGEAAADASGNDHNGIYLGEIVHGERSAYPNLGTAALFGGAGSRMQIPRSAAFDFGKRDFSIEFWFNCLETLGGRGDIFTYKGAGKDFGIFKPAGNANLIAIARPYRAFQAQTDPFSIGIWHHAVYVRRAEVDRWYVDGVLSGTATGNRQAIDMNADIVIGMNHYGDLDRLDTRCAWNGLIDEVAIYGQALSQQQVEAHFQAARQATP